MGNSTGSKSHFPSLFQNCVLWWPGSHCAGYSGDFDEFPIIPSGVTVTNNGTFTKTDLGNNRKVLNFDGSTNGIVLNSVPFDTGVFSISFWLNITSNAPMQEIVTFGTDSSSHNHLFQIRNGVIYIYQYNSEVLTVGVQTYSGLTTTNYWEFWTIVKYGTGANVSKLYKSGVIVGSITFPTTLSNFTNLGIGREAYQLGQLYSGNISGLQIWKGRALTAPEIKLLMNRTHPITGAGMIQGPYDYWRLS